MKEENFDKMYPIHRILALRKYIEELKEEFVKNDKKFNEIIDQIDITTLSMNELNAKYARITVLLDKSDQMTAKILELGKILMRTHSELTN